jgi:hypothetical protein
VIPRGTPEELTETIETIENTDVSDISGPMRLEDVFTWYFKYKLVRKYGVYKASILYAATFTGLIGILVLPMGLIDVALLLLVAIIVAFVFVVAMIKYWEIRSAPITGYVPIR